MWKSREEIFTGVKMGVTLSQDDAGQMPPLAEILETLFDRHRRSDGKPHTNEEVASAIREAGTDITQSYIWQLRHGQRADPRGSHLKGLATFFGYPAGYFLDVGTYRAIERQWQSGKVDPTAAVPHQTTAMMRQVEELSPQMQSVLGQLIVSVQRELHNK
jgi:ESX-1-secreted protein regulator